MGKGKKATQRTLRQECVMTLDPSKVKKRQKDKVGQTQTVQGPGEGPDVQLDWWRRNNSEIGSGEYWQWAKGAGPCSATDA
jgi:hypothetical protein